MSLSRATKFPALFAALLLTVTACSDNGGEGAGNGDEDRTVGIANFTLGGPYFSSMDAAIADQAEQAGVETISTDANYDAATLASDIEDLISNNVDAVIISGGPLESAPGALAALANADIPVVLVDRMFSDGEYASWVGPDNEALGEQIGEFLVDEMGEGKVAVIRGGPADNTIGLARTDGVTAALDGAGGFEIVTAPDFGDWGSDGGLEVMENLLAQHSDLDAVFCENDAMCLGAQRAISDAGLEDQIILGGVDGQTEALEQIMDDTNYVVSGLNDADEIGRLGLDRVLEILDGETVEEETVVPSPRVTAENADEHYDPDSEF